MLRVATHATAALALSVGSVACRREPPPERRAPPVSGSSVPATLPTSGKRCVVHLHGKGGAGRATELTGDVTHVHPAGNGEGWGGRQWLYFPESGYEEVRAIVAKAVLQNECRRVVVHGFSNGAAAAAKLFCRGETFDDTVLGYIVDDPVPDHGVDGCAPRPGIRVTVYTTGTLDAAKDGFRCADSDWTCEGGTTIGLTRYAASLGAVPRQSPNRTHEAYASPPEETP